MNIFNKHTGTDISKATLVLCGETSQSENRCTWSVTHAEKWYMVTSNMVQQRLTIPIGFTLQSCALWYFWNKRGGIVTVTMLWYDGAVREVYLFKAAIHQSNLYCLYYVINQTIKHKNKHTIKYVLVSFNDNEAAKHLPFPWSDNNINELKLVNCTGKSEGELIPFSIN